MLFLVENIFAGEIFLGKKKLFFDAKKIFPFYVMIANSLAPLSRARGFMMRSIFAVLL